MALQSLSFLKTNVAACDKNESISSMPLHSAGSKGSLWLPKKTRMGSVNKGFHFLGIQFTVARTTANSDHHEQPQSSVKVTLYPRSIQRSIDKLRLKPFDLRLLERNRYSSADHPAYVQRHCYRWANWWQSQHVHLSGARIQVAG